MSASRTRVGVRQFSSFGDDPRQTFQLLAPDGGLNVRHSVVVANRRIRLEDHLIRPVAHRIRHAHRVLAQQAELAIPFRIARRDHAAIAGADHFARVKGKASDVRVRPTDLLPLPVPQDFAADGARGILDDRKGMAPGDRDESVADRMACRSDARKGSPGFAR